MSKARLRRRLLAFRREDKRQLDLTDGAHRLPWIAPALLRLAARVPANRQWFP